MYHVPKRKTDHEGTRTLNLWIRSPAPYPLGHMTVSVFSINPSSIFNIIIKINLELYIIRDGGFAIGFISNPPQTKIGNQGIIIAFDESVRQVQYRKTLTWIHRKAVSHIR